jgi:hypothetical protein
LHLLLSPNDHHSNTHSDMCPAPEENGHANGNGTNGLQSNGDHSGYQSVLYSHSLPRARQWP